MTMKAIRVHQTGDPGVLKLEEVPDLSVGPDQVLVRVHAVGINPVETYIRSGVYPRTPPLPYTPGTDGAGVVLKAGCEVRKIGEGDRVYLSGSATGTYAEQALCAEHEVHPLPDSVSFEQGAGLGIPYGTAYRALFQKARAVPGETVLVHGASGGVGVAAIQLARNAGMQVIGTGGNDRGRQLVLEQGAHHALNHLSVEAVDSVMQLTGGKGVDVIVEMLSNQNLAVDLKVLASGGRIVVVGCRGPVEINPRDLMAHEAEILGMVLFNAPEAALRSIHAALVAGLENGSLRPVVGRRFSLAEAPLAHAAVLEPGAHGKIVLLP
jgi:NADPH:quinone reductase